MKPQRANEAKEAMRTKGRRRERAEREREPRKPYKAFEGLIRPFPIVPLKASEGPQARARSDS